MAVAAPLGPAPAAPLPRPRPRPLGPAAASAAAASAAAAVPSSRRGRSGCSCCRACSLARPAAARGEYVAASSARSRAGVAASLPAASACSWLCATWSLL